MWLVLNQAELTGPWATTTVIAMDYEQQEKGQSQDAVDDNARAANGV